MDNQGFKPTRPDPHIMDASDSPCDIDAVTQVIVEDTQRDMTALSISNPSRSNDDSDSILLLPGQTARELVRKLAAKSPTSMCTSCHAHPIAGSTAVSGVPSLCEHCDTAIWAASMCSYCSVRTVAVDSLCGMHLCDACDITMWVVRNEHSEHDA
jgi:hypothetical protein